MPGDVLWLAVPLAIVIAGIAAGRLLSAWFRYRGPRVISCPENCRPAGVSVDARHAALTGFAGIPQLRLADCSRWPEKAGCGQECLAQIEASPADCLVRNILIKWYAGKSCASCGTAFGQIEWAGQKPALMGRDRISIEWSQVPADKLHETLETALPVCFACHMANTLVRTHPDLVTDRSRRLIV